MTIYKITNIANDREFMIDTEHISMTIDEWVVHKANAYGDNPTVEVFKSDTEVNDELLKVKQKELLDASWAWIEQWHDNGGFIQLLAWKVDPSTSQTALDMIDAIDQWKNGVMGLYFAKKGALYADQPYDLDYSSAGAAPYTFTQVMNAVSS